MPVDAPLAGASVSSSAPAGRPDDDLSKIDTSLDETRDAAADFTSDSMPNIWALPDDHDEPEAEPEPPHEEPKNREEPVAPAPEKVVPSHPTSFSVDDDHDDPDSDAELEKPSFLRRLTKRHKDADSGDKTV